MVYPVNNIQNPEFSNLTTEFDNGTAIGMPPIQFNNRKNPPISNINNVNTYNPDYNPVRRYNSKQAPSNGSLTEAFLKARISPSEISEILLFVANVSVSQMYPTTE